MSLGKVACIVPSHISAQAFLANAHPSLPIVSTGGSPVEVRKISFPNSGPFDPHALQPAAQPFYQIQSAAGLQFLQATGRHVWFPGGSLGPRAPDRCSGCGQPGHASNHRFKCSVLNPPLAAALLASCASLARVLRDDNPMLSPSTQPFKTSPPWPPPEDESTDSGPGSGMDLDQ